MAVSFALLKAVLRALEGLSKKDTPGLFDKKPLNFGEGVRFDKKLSGSRGTGIISYL